MEHVRLGAILFPLAAYFLLLGAANSGRRPVLARGSHDLAALLLGLSGLIVLGLGPYFLHAGAIQQYGMTAWALFGTLIALAGGLFVYRQRYRWVVYNVSEGDFRGALERAAAEAGVGVEIRRRSISLPALGSELRLDVARMMRNVSLELRAGGIPWKT